MKIKKQRAQKSAIKTKVKFENYKPSLKATQLENKLNQLQQKNDVDSLQTDHKEFIKTIN